MDERLILSNEDDFIAAVREKGGVGVHLNCGGEDLIYCFAAITGALKNHFLKEGAEEESLKLLPEIVANVMADDASFPLESE